MTFCLRHYVDPYGGSRAACAVQATVGVNQTSRRLRRFFQCCSQQWHWWGSVATVLWFTVLCFLSLSTGCWKIRLSFVLMKCYILFFRNLVHQGPVASVSPQRELPWTFCFYLWILFPCAFLYLWTQFIVLACICVFARQLREDFDMGVDVQLDEEHNVHDVAALLKEFLRDMPDPLLPRELYPAFLHANCKQIYTPPYT